MPKSSSISIAMVALGPGAKLSSSAIRNDLTSSWPDIETPTAPEKSNASITFQVGDAHLALGLMGAPIPWSDLKGPCSTSWIWPDAATEMRQHKTHVIVTVWANCEPIERYALLTQVTAAVAGTCAESIGVFWCDSRLVVSAEMFRDFALRVLPNGPPLHIWINPRVGRKDGKSGGYTTGMTALGHKEIETTNAPESPSELQERIVALAAYLLDNGPIIKDGETIGNDADERIEVTFGPSSYGHKGKVMNLDFDFTPPKKSWWDRG